jgi:DNA-binding response OmpR family regulator
MSSQMELSSAATLVRTIPPQAATIQTMTALARPIQVLLVEDDADAAALVEAYLTQDQASPFRVEWAPNLVETMIRLGQPGIDVVLLDLGLPELNGYKSYRAVEATVEGNLPIVILTSDERSLSKELTLGFGAADYLLKSKNSPSQLRQALRNAVVLFRPRHEGGT